MSWYYADHGRQAGPVDDASLDALISQGTLRPDTLVWREGMANWQALSTVRPPAATIAPAPAPVYAPPAPQPQPSFQQPQPLFDAQQPSFQPQPSFQSQPSAGVAMGTQGVTCANCGQVFSQSDVVFIGSSYVCAGCKPIFLQRMREGSAGGALGTRRYAGFWIRVASYLIDIVIMYAAIFVIGFVAALPFGVLGFSSSDAAVGLVTIFSALVGITIALGYHGYFVSTRGGTPGKLLLGLRIIRSDGSNLTFGRAVARLLAYMVSGIILYIGFILAAFDAEKRCLHDHLCDTRVIYK